MKNKIVIAIALFISFHHAMAKTVTLTAIEKTLWVNGKSSQVFDIVQPDGTEGYVGNKGDYFDVTLKNATHVPISIHWHGLILPNDQDGVAFVTQLPIPPGSSHHYYFKIQQAGTFWMHSHLKFNEQKLMTAPLILKDPNDPYAADKDVTVMLQGFTFKNPEKILYNLKHSDMAGMDMSKPDLNDVDYDAYLANRRTLADPEVITVKPLEKIRLRLINASSASNLWINTGALTGKAIAVDGNLIKPIQSTHFQIADAQRMDVEVIIPSTGGAFPILAQAEGTNQQTGIILATQDATLPHLSETAKITAPALNNQQEMQLHALQPLQAKPISKRLTYKLSGNMMKYVWKINNEIWPHVTPDYIKLHDRVEMVFINASSMAHPMHFHGHVFQVTEINGKKLSNGPLRDTILVLPHTTEKIIFDADHPGIWVMHCHVLYHMEAGMMTTVNYVSYPEPGYYRKLIAGKSM